MLYVSHALDEVARLGRRDRHPPDGRVARQGSVFDLLTRSIAASAGSLGAVIETRVEAQRADGLSGLAFDGGTIARVRRICTTPARRGSARAHPRRGDHAGARGAAHDQRQQCVARRAFRRSSRFGARMPMCSCSAAARARRANHAGVAARLALAAGKPVFAIIKSVIVDSSN